VKPILSMDFIRRKSLAYEERARNGQDFFYLSNSIYSAVRP